MFTHSVSFDIYRSIKWDTFKAKFPSFDRTAPNTLADIPVVVFLFDEEVDAVAFAVAYGPT